MEGTMLISEKGGNGSAIAKENRTEIEEAKSVEACNEFLKNGWGLLTVVSTDNFDERNGFPCSIVYIVYRTAK